jgi:hypothetical protein
LAVNFFVKAKKAEIYRIADKTGRLRKECIAWVPYN